MLLNKAKKLLEEEYEKAKKLEFVHNPMAYALYQVWRKADRESCKFTGKLRGCEEKEKREEMSIGEAVAIFCDLGNEDYSVEEKELAIYKVMNMPTHNGVSKKYMLQAIKWLWHQNYEIEE